MGAQLAWLYNKTHWTLQHCLLPCLVACMTDESVHLVSLCRWPSRGNRSNVLAFLVIPLIWTSIPSNLPEGPWAGGQLQQCLCTHENMSLQYVCRSVMTIRFTRHSHMFRQHASVWSGSYLFKLLMVCIVGGVPRSALGPEKPVLWMPSVLYHSHSLSKVRRRSRGSIPPKWPCFEDFILSVAPANSGHACFWRFLLNSTAHDLIFCFSQTAV